MFVLDACICDVTRISRWHLRAAYIILRFTSAFKQMQLWANCLLKADATDAVRIIYCNHPVVGWSLIRWLFPCLCPLRRGCERSDVTKHMLIHEAPKLVCDICGKTFRHQKNKDLHMKRWVWGLGHTWNGGLGSHMKWWVRVGVYHCQLPWIRFLSQSPSQLLSALVGSGPHRSLSSLLPLLQFIL